MMIWLYNRVLNITTSKNIINNFYEALELTAESGNPLLKKCLTKNFNIENNIFNILKFIYEFLHLYPDIKNKISEKYDENVELYCKHIKENFRYYNIIKKKCTIKKECKYHTELMNFKNQFSSAEVLDFIYKNCRYKKTLCKNDTNLSNDIPCLEKSDNFVKITKQDGSWLRTKIGKEKSIQKHMNKENYDNLEYLQKIASTYSDNKIYNIKYD
ncbi:hypothetical protein PVMG_06259 [Plasmodium vivax Mauritania I]|uniref:Variable surface protein n=1 Tax=Plasmodium vivax Mauritania I TaxID=1035515 RepID=A0A0J9T4D1_PLAVI|nr:hypothetical protein PVMG_06259 [Plasmodium vivax Mauritania I]